MPKKQSNFNNRISYLREILEKYGKIPSQKENRDAYAALKYYLKNYNDTPEIKNLIEEFNLHIPERKKKEDVSYSDVEDILREYERIPHVREDQQKYCAVAQYFRSHNDSKTERLKWIYAKRDYFPLPNSKFGPRPKWDNNAYIIIGDREIPGTFEFLEWRWKVTEEYILKVYDMYGVLPGDKIKPMETFEAKLYYFYRYNVDCNKSDKEKITNIVTTLYKKSCRDKRIVAAIYSFDFSNHKYQDRVRQILIDKGACTCQFLAHNIIPGVELSVDFVFYYYYNLNNDTNNNWDVMPLGNLYSHGVHASQVFFVHYRDFYLCNLQNIREHAIKYYRNWEDYQPQNDEESIAYAQSCFLKNDVDISIGSD